MIKRILDPEEFKKVTKDIFSLYQIENENNSHEFLKFNQEIINNSFSNKFLLAWDIFVWTNHNGKNYDSIIIFLNDKNIKYENPIFSEFIWLSKNPKVGYKLFKEAIKFAKKNKFKYILVDVFMKNINHEKLLRFYKKMGFIKNSETYTAKL